MRTPHSLVWVFARLFLCGSALGQVAPTEQNLRDGVARGGNIIFSGSGIIALNAPVVVTLDTTIDGNGNDVVLDGQTLTWLLEVSPGVHLTLANLVLANGLARGADAATSNVGGGVGYGGALRNQGGVVTLSNCVLTNNGAVGGTGFIVPVFMTPASVGGAGCGGAIWQSGGSLLVQGGRFAQNNAAGAAWGIGPEPGRGGAICATGGTVRIVGTSFSANSATGGGTAGFNPGGEGAGGALFADGAQVELNAVRFTNNFASALANSLGFGGAIAMQSGSLLVSNSHFAGNVAHGGVGASPRGTMIVDGFAANGGALYVGTNASASLHNSALAENVSIGGRRSHPNYPFLGQDGPGYGGAVYNDGVLSVVNATFVANAATNFWHGPPGRGGVVFNAGAAGLTNVTTCSNTSEGPRLVSTSGTLTLKNSLLSESRHANAGTGITDGGHNLSATATPLFTEPSSRTNQDLKLGPVGEYSGPTPTIPLLAGSPAIDAADGAAAPGTDQRGRTRPYGTQSDIGAFESSPPYSILGTLHGYLHSGMSADAGQAGQSIENGAFRFVASEGTSTFNFHGTNAFFRPNPLVVNVSADVKVDVRAFAFYALAYDPDLPAPTFTFAGRAGEVWEFDSWTGTEPWTPMASNAFTADGLYSLTFTNGAPAVMLKAIRR